MGVGGRDEDWKVSPKGIATVEADSCLISVNQAAARLSLLGFEELETTEVGRLRGYARNNDGPRAALPIPEEGLTIFHENSAALAVQGVLKLVLGEVEQLGAVSVDPHGRESPVLHLDDGRVAVRSHDIELVFIDVQVFEVNAVVRKEAILLLQ